jgi:hypothetical protein
MAVDSEGGCDETNPTYVFRSFVSSGASRTVATVPVHAHAIVQSAPAESSYSGGLSTASAHLHDDEEEEITMRTDQSLRDRDDAPEPIVYRKMSSRAFASSSTSLVELSGVDLKPPTSDTVQPMQPSKSSASPTSPSKHRSMRPASADAPKLPNLQTANSTSDAHMTDIEDGWTLVDKGESSPRLLEQFQTQVNIRPPLPGIPHPTLPSPSPPPPSLSPPPPVLPPKSPPPPTQPPCAQCLGSSSGPPILPPTMGMPAIVDEEEMAAATAALVAKVGGSSLLSTSMMSVPAQQVKTSVPSLNPEQRYLLVSEALPGKFYHERFAGEAAARETADSQFHCHVLYEEFGEGKLPRELLKGGVGFAHGSIRRHTTSSLLHVPPSAVAFYVLLINREGRVDEFKHADEQAARAGAQRLRINSWVLYAEGTDGACLELELTGQRRSRITAN